MKSKPKAGGPKPIASISGVLARCSQRGGCWIWGRHMHNDFPAAKLDGKKNTSIRRWVFKEAHKSEPGFVMPEFVSDTCGQKHCCNPAHLVAMTPAERAQKAAKNRKNEPLHRMRIAAAHVATGRAKLSYEAAAAIRNDQRPAAVLAAEHGVRVDYLQAVRRGKHWKAPPTPMGAIAAALVGIAA